ncbi:MAG: ATP-binding protein [Actinomycetes bacterium]
MTGLSVSQETTAGCAVVTLTGRLAAKSYAQVRTAFNYALAELPDAVIFDVDAVTHAHRDTSDWFAAMAGQAAQWPGIPWVLAGADGGPVSRLVRHNGGSSLPRFLTVAEALEAMSTARARVEARFVLPPKPEAVGAARQFVAAACREWNATAYEWAAPLVTSELVTNAVLHTGTSVQVICSYGDNGFRLAVRDGLGEPPTRLNPTPDGERGRGLFLVHRLANGWGTLPTSDGGKVVWCLVAPSDDADLVGDTR